MEVSVISTSPYCSHGADIIEIAKEAEPAKTDEVLVEVPKKEDSGPKDSITLGSQLFS